MMLVKLDQVLQSYEVTLCFLEGGSSSYLLCVHLADAVFLILYKELYYRHIYAKVSVSTYSLYIYLIVSKLC